MKNIKTLAQINSEIEFLKSNPIDTIKEEKVSNLLKIYCFLFVEFITLFIIAFNQDVIDRDAWLIYWVWITGLTLLILVHHIILLLVHNRQQNK